MSIYTGGITLRNLKKDAAKKISKKDTTQRKKEGTWASILALAKPAAGFLAKAGITALGVTNPYLLPLLYGLGTSGVTKGIDFIGRKFGAGADPSKIKATGKYGYGREEAKTLSEGLIKSIEERDPLSKQNVGADIAGSYLSALIPKIGIDPKTGEMGVQGGDLGEVIKEDVGKGVRAVKNKFLPSMEKATGLATAELSPFAAQIAKDPSKALSSYYQDAENWESYYQALPSPVEEFDPYEMQQGGQVPKYYGGGSVSGGSPTIAGYFNEQGKTLGGSSTQSLSQMLGRK